MCRIDLVIVDLDNTIYDWVEYYIPAFQAMTSVLNDITGIDESELRASFKRVHQEHHSAEYPYSIQELDVLTEDDKPVPSQKVMEKYRPAIEAFQRVRDEKLELYPGVEDTLAEINEDGRKLVAYTDAVFSLAARRIRDLDVEEYFHGLVAKRNHDLPEGTIKEDVLEFHQPDYQPGVELTEQLSPDISKPNPEILSEITDSFDASPRESVYVGDSLFKDIQMAQQSNVHDVYARYGSNHDPEKYKVLVEISHWTEEEIRQAQEFDEESVVPSFVIDSFSELADVLDGLESSPESQ